MKVIKSLKIGKKKLFSKNEEFDIVFKKKSQSVMEKISSLTEEQAAANQTIFQPHDSGIISVASLFIFWNFVLSCNAYFILEHPGPFYVYTSNVDAHSLKAGFNRTEVFEIHGNTETWQCSVPCSELIWKAPENFLFNIDEMGFCDVSKSTNSTESRFEKNAPNCHKCGAAARPSVLMFYDYSYLGDTIPPLLNRAWEASVISCLKNNEKSRVVVVEIGCGANVTTVRHHSEKFLASCAFDAPGRCTLIR